MPTRATPNQSPAARRHATVAAGFVTGMLSGMRLRGIDPAPILAAAGLTPESFGGKEARIPVEQYAALYNEVVRTLDDEGFGLFSAPLRLVVVEPPAEVIALVLQQRDLLAQSIDCGL